MNRGSVQHEGVLPSWRTIPVLQAGDLERLRPVPLGYQIVPVGGRTTVFAVVRFLPDQTSSLQVLDGPLDSTAGEGEVPGNGVDARPADIVLALAVVQVEVDQLCPVRYIHGVEEVQFSHNDFSFVLLFCQGGAPL